MSSVITTDFERWKAQEAALGKPVALNEFVFANVPGLDPSKDISRDEKLPPAGQIVHRQAVNKAGLASENAVAYSVTLGTDVGDFVFNWIGLINKESGTLAMITHAPEQRKIKTVDGVQGNVLTRSFLLEFNGAAKETQITTSAETWQIDFTARLTGMDEAQRLANRDIYGASAFFGDGFLVTKAAEQYRVTPGTAYIEGLRGTLEEITTFNNLRDTKIYADFTFQGNLVSKWQTFVKVTTAKTLAHYQDAAGFQHYVAVIAEIDQNGNIKDKRVKGTAIDRELAELKKDIPEKYQPIGDYQPAGSYATKQELNSGLGKKWDKSAPLHEFPDAVITEKSDLNNYKVPGDFIFSNDAIGSHFPDVWGGYLEVRKNLYSRIDQVFTVYSSNEKYFRSSQGTGEFSAWVSLYTSGNTKTDKNGYIRVNGSTGELIGIPVGSSVFWNTSAPIPDNFWPHEGRSFSASEYPELAKVIPSLKLPDDRGYAIRVADNGKGIDPGRTVGSFQEDAIRNFTGWFGERDFRSPNNGNYFPFLWGQTGVFKSEKRISSEGASPVMEKAESGNWSGVKFDPSLVVPTANENRMKNVAKILIMRVK